MKFYLNFKLRPYPDETFIVSKQHVRGSVRASVRNALLKYALQVKGQSGCVKGPKWGQVGSSGIKWGQVRLSGVKRDQNGPKGGPGWIK